MEKLPGYKITMADGTEADRIPMRLKKDRALPAPPYRTIEQREQIKNRASERHERQKKLFAEMEKQGIVARFPLPE